MCPSWIIPLVSLSLGGAPLEKTPPWHTDVAAALAEARRAHKPIFVVAHCPH
jgi:hypothetical protein